MRPYDWDKSIEELCSSKEEAQELKEVASLLRSMPGVRASSSFQAELKARLMEKALSEDMYALEGNKKENKVLHLMNIGYRYGGKILKARPLFTAVAAVFVILMMAVFYSQGRVEPPAPPQIASSENPARSESAPEILVEHRAENGEEERNSIPAKPGQQELEDSHGAGNIVPPEDTPSEKATPPEETPVKENPDEDPAGPNVPEVTETQPLKSDPEFEVWKNRQHFVVAGQINLPPVYYGVERDAALPAERVSCSWTPWKTTPVSKETGESVVFGTEAWAEEILSNNGFIFSDGDYLEINLQETQKGLFAEVFYRPQKNAGKALTLVLHCQEGAGILSYYYKEEGEAAKPGYYPLLTPSEAFKQVDTLQWYASSPRLDLSFQFQEVTLTYNDFLLVKNGRQDTVRLPAYCFLGRETNHNGGVLKLFLPAVKQ